MPCGPIFIIAQLEPEANLVIVMFAKKKSSFFFEESASKISVSKARQVFMQLKPHVSFCSKISMTSLLVGRVIITLDKSLSTLLLRELGELHFLGLKPILTVHQLKPVLNNFTQKNNVLCVVQIDHVP